MSPGRARPVTRRALLGGLAAGAVSACAPRSATPSAASSTLPEPPPLPQRERGVCLAHDVADGGRRGYGSAPCAQVLDRLVELGVTSVSLSPYGFVRRGGRIERVAEDSIGETDGRIARVTEAARARGLRVVLKPHLWLDDGSFVGHMDGTRAPAFLAAYDDFLGHYAQLAEALALDALVVGTELGGFTRAHGGLLPRWATAARARFRGELVYAANWDELPHLTDATGLDTLGVQFYPPVARHASDDDATIVGRMHAALDGALADAARLGRPLVLTEVGYRADPEALLHPSGWPEHRVTRADAAHQARAFRLLGHALAARPAVRGLYVWKVFSDPESREEGPAGFSPLRTPTARVLARLFGGRA